MFEKRRGHTEPFSPDVSQPWEPPGGGGVEPVVGPGGQVDPHLVQLPSAPGEAGVLRVRLAQEGVETVICAWVAVSKTTKLVF